MERAIEQVRFHKSPWKKQPLAITEWNERLWITLLDTATVQRDGKIVFRFKSGREIIK